MNPRPFNSRDSWRTSLLLAADLVLDQGVKALVAATLPLGSSVALTPWFNFVHVLNPGAAFSFLADAGGWQRHALSGIGIAVSLALAVLLRRGVRHHLEAAAYVGLIGGALGNVTDRLRIGAVVDYLDLYWRDLHRPAFNLADVFVLGSAGLLALASFKSGVPAAPPGQSDTNRGLASTPFKNIDNGAAEFGRRVSLPGGECDTDAARYPMSIEHPLPQLGGHRVRGLWTPLFLAWLIALLATAGALFLGEVMGMTPCVLCWYQRIAMFPLAVILGVGVLDTDIRCVRYALPFAWAGWGLAVYHCLIFWGVVAEGLVPCGKGSSCADADLQVAGFVPIPLLSLIAFSAIVALLWFAEKRTKT